MTSVNWWSPWLPPLLLIMPPPPPRVPGATVQLTVQSRGNRATAPTCGWEADVPCCGTASGDRHTVPCCPTTSGSCLSPWPPPLLEPFPSLLWTPSPVQPTVLRGICCTNGAGGSVSLPTAGRPFVAVQPTAPVWAPHLLPEVVACLLHSAFYAGGLELRFPAPCWLVICRRGEMAAWIPASTAFDTPRMKSSIELCPGRDPTVGGSTDPWTMGCVGTKWGHSLAVPGVTPLVSPGATSPHAPRRRLAWTRLLLLWIIY